MDEVFKRHYAKKKKFIDSMKNDGCSVCGEKDTRCLDLHHVDSESKKFSVSGSSWGRSYKSLAEEASKCVILCANCHRKLHHP